MGKALFILQHLKWFHNRFKNEDLSEWTIDCDDYNRIDEAIAELEAMKPKTCEGCKWEQETNLIRTKVGDKVDICTLCTRYENLQDNYEKKDNA